MSPRPSRMSESEIADGLRKLEGWSLLADKLHREFKFANFVEAFSFMSALALHAEKADHHPEWFNVYGTVRIDLTTHDAGGITELDFDLARHADRLAKNHVHS